MQTHFKKYHPKGHPHIIVEVVKMDRKDPELVKEIIEWSEQAFDYSWLIAAGYGSKEDCIKNGAIGGYITNGHVDCVKHGSYIVHHGNLVFDVLNPLEFYERFLPVAE